MSRSSAMGWQVHRWIRQPGWSAVPAAQMARACGPRGSTAEYLRNTVLSLEEHGIHDRKLWTLQRLVAREIEAAFVDRAGSAEE